MVRKAVSFTSELETFSSKKFTTWPQGAIKSSSPTQVANAESKDVKTLVFDLYHRYQKLNEHNTEASLQHIVDGNCEDPLVGYSVLNLILKSMRGLESEDEPWANACEPDFDARTISSLLKRACEDFDEYSRSENVVDFRVLQQIMRSVESLWGRIRHTQTGFDEELNEFAQRCIRLINDRPGSKLLLSSAVRISNLILEDSRLSEDQVTLLVSALSKTQFAFAASFSVEVMMLLNTVQRVSPAVFQQTQAAWVPLVTRGLASSSGIARSLALQLLAPCVGKEAAATLSEPCDTRNGDSEPLIRFLVRKMLSIVNSHAFEDVKFVVQCWCLILRSAMECPGEWKLLDQWLEVERAAFHAFPKLIPFAWDTILEAQSADVTYCKALVAPFMALSGSVELSVNKLLTEALAVVDCNQDYVWDALLLPVFKILSHRRDSGLTVCWGNMHMNFKEEKVSEYLGLLGVLVKHTTQQNISSFEAIWKKVVLCCKASRSRAMEVVRFHYHLFAQDTSAALNYPLMSMLTNTLLRNWSFTLLSERPKNSSFSLLTLILLPITVFVPAAKQSEYLDNVLANSKSESMLRSMLLALLHTVHTGTDNQLVKWFVASSTIREYIGSSQDQLSASLCRESLTTFLSYRADADASHWAEWQALFMITSAGRDKVMAKVNEVSIQGLKHILSIPGYNEDKVRVVASTFKGLPAAKVPLLISTVKNANLSSESLDNIARTLVSQKTLAAVNCAIELVTAKRIFVIAKPLLAVIDETHASELIDLWNSKIVEYLRDSPAFVSKAQATRFARETPKLTIPHAIVISSINYSPTPTPQKRPKSLMETPPDSAKRPRRAILTGSVPPPLATPPVSSDPPDDSDNGSIREDLLCSSPPSRSSDSGSMPRSQTWRNSQERARTLKRVMMGLDIEEAVQDMKRSEKEMIYNLMFRSCVQLRTHLAATGAPLPSTETEKASIEIQEAKSKYEALVDQENMMIENGRRRLELGTLNDDEDDDEENDEDDDDEYEPGMVKLEVA